MKLSQALLRAQYTAIISLGFGHKCDRYVDDWGITVKNSRAKSRRPLIWAVLLVAAVSVAIIWGLQIQNGTLRAGNPGSESGTAAAPGSDTEEIPQGMDDVDPADDPVEQAAPDPSNVPSGPPATEAEPKNMPEQAENVSKDLAQTTETHLDAFYESYSKVLAAPEEAVESLNPELEETLQNAALGQVQASVQEYAANGWVMTGSPNVVASTVSKLDKDAEPPTMTVYACIDSSPVKITTTTGTQVPSNNGRSMNIIELQKNDDGSWIIVNTSFPDDPSC